MSAPSRRPRAGARRPEWNVYSTRQKNASSWRQPQERRGGMSAAENEIEGDAPRDFAALRALSGARADRLPRRLRQVASYALNHPDEIAFGTAASVAASAEVQPSTLVRFSQSLGYQGYSDFQDGFRATTSGWCSCARTGSGQARPASCSTALQKRRAGRWRTCMPAATPKRWSARSQSSRMPEPSTC